VNEVNEEEVDDEEDTEEDEGDEEEEEEEEEVDHATALPQWIAETPPRSLQAARGSPGTGPA
jgi:hypothetical protein